MSEQEDPKSKYSECKIQIQTLFSRLTEIIIQNCATREDIANMLVAVGNWVGIIFASLVVMIEGNNQDKTFSVVDRITDSMNRDIKNHVILIRGVSKQAKGEEKRIILPKGVS